MDVVCANKFVVLRTFYCFRWIGLLVCTCLGGSQPLLAASDERSALTNLRQSLDLSSRTIATNSDTVHLAALGLDLHTVVGSRHRNIGVLTFQPYLLKINGATPPGPPFDGEDWALQWRIANFNYTALGQGKFNIRLGHFELPFGLEQVEQTNGTLYQLNSPNLGLKADWGTSINGAISTWEYELAYMLGEGNEISSSRGGLWVGRVGKQLSHQLRIGLSGLDGEQQEPQQIQRHRLGIDLRYQIGHGFAGAYEVAQGDDAGNDVRHHLAQIQWLNRNESLNLHLQWRRADIKGPSSYSEDSLRLGFRYEPNRHWSVSAQWQTLTNPGPGNRVKNEVTAQLRFRT